MSTPKHQPDDVRLVIDTDAATLLPRGLRLFNVLLEYLVWYSGDAAANGGIAFFQSPCRQVWVCRSVVKGGLSMEVLDKLGVLLGLRIISENKQGR